MPFLDKIRWNMVGILGKIILFLWAKSTRMKILGEESYQKLREQGKPVIFLVWHGRIFIVPYFFRRRKIMPLVSPSEDGEIPAQIMSRWGYRIVRGSSSHVIRKAWNVMIKELQRGGEVIIVPDGPRGPNREMKLGGLKLAQETGAYLVPFTFSTSRKKFLRSWDSFLLFYPFSRVVAVYGQPIAIESDLKGDALETERQRIEKLLVQLDEKADKYHS
ncbi:MAG: lysophospholipid acyltransferase family protein [Candidatus Aminicenantes bacterium]|nr:MAG: lysophospholipid acyltransferase family protein [Candidatus Aminicenantes bacterium]